MKMLLAVLMLTPVFAFAEVYKWIDENGNIHFGDRPQHAQAVAVEVNTQKAGTTYQPEKPKAVKPKVENNELKEAEEKYKEVLAGFYETRTPSAACKYTIDLKDEMKYMGSSAQLMGRPMPKREVYLCPKE